MSEYKTSCGKCGIIINQEYSCLQFDEWVVTAHRVTDKQVAYSWIDNVFNTLHANTMNIDDFKDRFKVR